MTTNNIRNFRKPLSIMLIALFTIVSTPSSVMANDADLNKIL